jgi:hypothetical protein
VRVAHYSVLLAERFSTRSGEVRSTPNNYILFIMFNNKNLSKYNKDFYLSLKSAGHSNFLNYFMIKYSFNQRGYKVGYLYLNLNFI